MKTELSRSLSPFFPSYFSWLPFFFFFLDLFFLVCAARSTLVGIFILCGCDFHKEMGKRIPKSDLLIHAWSKGGWWMECNGIGGGMSKLQREEKYIPTYMYVAVCCGNSLNTSSSGDDEFCLSACGQWGQPASPAP